MKEFTLKDPRAMGDADPKYGQSYWSYTHDSQTPVMFNLMDGQVGEGSRISAETVELKTSSKGTEYHRLRKVKILGQQQVTTSHKTNEELILSKLDEVLSLLKEPKTLGQQWKDTTGKTPKQLDNVVEDIGDDPIDLSAIPF